MEAVSLFILASYNLLFFWKFYQNPYLNYTSEIATTFYPHWVWIGRTLRRLAPPIVDKIYFRYPAAIPFLSTFYLPHLVTSLTESFKVLQYSILFHYLLGSYLAFTMFSQWVSVPVALFGAITLTYAGYCIKIQQPCIAYTLAWIPGIFIHGWLGVISVAMCFYAGYYPILVYLLPFLLLMHTKTVLLGALFALPQLIPFLWYYMKSVRWKVSAPSDKKFGRVPPSKLTELFLPTWPRTHTNGVMFMEMTMYIGLLPLVFMWGSDSKFWYVLLYGLMTVVGLLPAVERIPARALYIVTLSVAVLATDGLNKLSLASTSLWAVTFLQSYLLLFNRDIYPCFPFSQWWSKPREIDMDYTGYLSGKSIHAYSGAFSLRDQ